MVTKKCYKGEGEDLSLAECLWQAKNTPFLLLLFYIILSIALIYYFTIDLVLLTSSSYCLPLLSDSISILLAAQAKIQDHPLLFFSLRFSDFVVLSFETYLNTATSQHCLP